MGDHNVDKPLKSCPLPCLGWYESQVSIYNGVQITRNPAILSGRPTIGGHRIAVHNVVVRRQCGESVEEIAEGYGITIDEVLAAFAYYEDHKAALDREIEADRQEFARRVAADTSPIAARMRELGRNRGIRRAE